MKFWTVLSIVILTSLTMSMVVYGAAAQNTDVLTASWESNNMQYAQFTGNSRIKVVLTNLGATSSLHLTVDLGSSELTVTPVEMDVVDLQRDVAQNLIRDVGR